MMPRDASEDRRLPYAAMAYSDDVLVIGPDGEHLLQVPRNVNGSTHQRRTYEERWSIATTLSRLLNEESERCRKGADAVRIEEMAHG